MKKSIFKKVIAAAMCLSIIGTGMSSTVSATSDTASKNYGSYGTLKGSNNFYKQAGLPKSKRIDLEASIGKTVNYIGVKVSVKNYSTGKSYYSMSPAGSKGKYHHRDFEFNSSHNVYKNKCSAFGTHEFRHSSSGVVYTSTTC